MSKKEKNKLPEENLKSLSTFECLNDRQKELKNSIIGNTVTICTGIAGSGKSFVSLGTALELLGNKYTKIVMVKSVVTVPEENIGFIPGPQPLYSQLVTPNGWTSMQDIKIGDEVIGRDGYPEKVIGIYPKGEKEIYRVTLGDGRFTDCCADHMWKVKTHGKEFDKLYNTEYIFNNIQNKSFFLPLNDIVHYDKISLPIDPYLIGVLIGDGIISGSHVRFCSNDDEIINNIKNIISEYNLNINKKDLIYTISSDKSSTSAGAREMARKNVISGEVEILGYLQDACKLLNIKSTTLIGRCIRESIIDNYAYFFTGNISKSSNYVKQVLIDCGLFGLKAWEKHIPHIYKYTSVEDRISLLQGLLDTDGSIKVGGRDLIYYTTSEILKDDVIELVRSLGGTARVCVRDREGVRSIINGEEVVSRRICYDVYINFYTNIFNPFRLKRKAERFVPKTTFCYATKIKSIEKIGTEKVQCIKVDNPEHLYLTDNFIVTHNTWEEKMEPFMISFTGNIDKIFDKRGVSNDLIKKGILEILPIAYVRGITQDNCIVILDECQNLSLNTFKTVITRIGNNCKYIILGDIEQIDRKKKEESCLSQLVDLFRDSQEIAVVEFDDDDCVRNPIIKPILERIRTIEK